MEVIFCKILTLYSKVISEIDNDDVGNQLSEDENNVPPAEVVSGPKFGQLQRKVYAKKSKAASCRELLTQIRNMTYVIYDNDVLDCIHRGPTRYKIIENHKK